LNSWVLGIKGFWYTCDIERGEDQKWKTQKKRLKIRENIKTNNIKFKKTQKKEGVLINVYHKILA
jgi:hypothetical protein